MKPPNAGKGRKKGVPNKATANAREAIAKFVDGNAHRLQAWLDEVYMQDGAQAALDCFNKLIEYHVPKLGRTELTGADGGPLGVQIVRFTDPTPQQLAAASVPDGGVAKAGTGMPPRGSGLAPKER